MLQTHWHTMPHDSIFFTFVILFTSSTLEPTTKLSTLSPKLHVNKFNHFQKFLGLIGDQGMESSISIDHSLIITRFTMRNVECMHCINNMIYTHTHTHNSDMSVWYIYIYKHSSLFFCYLQKSNFSIWEILVIFFKFSLLKTQISLLFHIVMF